jgi:hypothetical protein
MLVWDSMTVAGCSAAWLNALAGLAEHVPLLGPYQVPISCGALAGFAWGAGCTANFRRWYNCSSAQLSQGEGPSYVNLGVNI